MQTNDDGFDHLVASAAEAHLDRCWDWFNYHEYDGEEGPPEGSDPASAPFDGCSTCEVREVLFIAWPMIEAHYADRSGDEPDSPVEGTPDASQEAP